MTDISASIQTETRSYPAQWLIQAESLLGRPLSEAELERFQRVYDLLIDYNSHTNLTRITDWPDYLNRHILDSLTLYKWLPEGAKVADVGSGAGFPSIPLAIVRPDCSITAIESVGKKTKFIWQVIEALEITNLTVLQERAETLGQDAKYREQFDIVTARALAPMPTLVELLAPLVKPFTAHLPIPPAMVMLKSNQYEQELAMATQACKTLSLELMKTETSSIEALIGSTILVFHKTRPTLTKFPRANGLPKKQPL
jgi:16S rRNA (guanine527-N7)-methyltransferase